MRWCHYLLVLVVAGALVRPSSAGIFGKKTKPNPAERVPELLVTVKNDKDESKRASAAEELRQYDPSAYPDIVPVLIDVLMNDAKPSVRAEAADSLGKLRPISQEAGWALEQAHAKDGSMRVRLQTRYALMSYHWAGYQNRGKDVKDGKDGKGAPAKDAPKGPVISPPPLINTLLAPLKPVPVPVPVPVPPKASATTNESAPPPLADPTTARPLSAGPWKPARTVTSQGLKIPVPTPPPGPEIEPPKE